MKQQDFQQDGGTVPPRGLQIRGRMRRAKARFGECQGSRSVARTRRLTRRLNAFFRSRGYSARTSGDGAGLALGSIALSSERMRNNITAGVTARAANTMTRKHSA